MRWQGRRGSRNIEDRRGRTRSRTAKGGVGGLGIGGLLLVLAVGYFFGVDVSPLLQGGDTSGSSVQSSAPDRAPTAAEQQQAQFVSVVLADTEEVWAKVFGRQLGAAYTPPTLVLYSGATRSPCGGASGASGPFYCPADRKAYLDTAFFQTMERRLGAGGDFAAAYVIAHEVAHHVQNELGILGRANSIRAQSSESQANQISVRIELQADCLSGIWAREAQAQFGSLEQGDIEEAVNAARQIGDDTLQRNAGRIPMPHTFTHGTSQQRARWFTTGYQSGAIADCDTFSARRL